eukprot:CAMPEP_0182437380 /NCGR_PEP_ID=MMETSP1167-20130531/85000_1 /TAXON_ID=2988 /ORGANISM="Mallomonas Sp, Strain CCMP3275" /LENGTH=680 /DNA_ID=CAMNT_0024630273 /DNA_START=117 /DNA_END=2159 /DNA_ORIENTATION=-
MSDPELDNDDYAEEEYAGEEFEDVDDHDVPSHEPPKINESQYSERFDVSLEDNQNNSNNNNLTNLDSKPEADVGDGDDDDPFAESNNNNNNNNENNNDDDDPFTDNNKSLTRQNEGLEDKATNDDDDDDPFGESSPTIPQQNETKTSKQNDDDDDPFGDENTNDKEEEEEGEEEEEEGEGEEPDIEGMDLEVYMTSVMPVESLDRGDPELPEEERLKNLDPMFRPLVGMSPPPGLPRPRWASQSFDEEEFAQSQGGNLATSSSNQSGSESPIKSNQISTNNINSNSNDTILEDANIPTSTSTSRLNKESNESMASIAYTPSDSNIISPTPSVGEKNATLSLSLSVVAEVDDDSILATTTRSRSMAPEVEEEREEEKEREMEYVPKGTLQRLQNEITLLKSQVNKSRLSNYDEEDTVASEVTNLRSYASTLHKNIKHANNMLAVEALLKGIDLHALSVNSGEREREKGGKGGLMAGKSKKIPSPPSQANTNTIGKKGRNFTNTATETEGNPEEDRITALQKEIKRREEKQNRTETQLSVVATACLDLKKQVKALHRIIRSQETELKSKDMRAPKKISKDVCGSPQKGLKMVDKEFGAAPERRSSLSSGGAGNKGRILALEERIDDLQTHVKEMRIREKELVDQVLNLTHKNDSLLIQIKRSGNSTNNNNNNNNNININKQA